MSKIKENTFLSQELHSQVVYQSEITGASKSAIIAEAVKVYYSMDIDERIARVNNRIKELKKDFSDNGKSFTCRDQEIKALCNHEFVPFGKILNGAQNAICKKCGYSPSQTTEFSNQLEVKINL